MRSRVTCGASTSDSFASRASWSRGDGELFEVAPPFLAFRALVIAHPRWYPHLSDRTRTALLRFARAMTGDAPFDPPQAFALLSKAT
jgi:hypothetical protein